MKSPLRALLRMVAAQRVRDQLFCQRGTDGGKESLLGTRREKQVTLIVAVIRAGKCIPDFVIVIKVKTHCDLPLLIHLP